VIGNRTLLFFGDIKSNAYAVDARTGARVWRTLPASRPPSAPPRLSPRPRP